MDSPRVDGHLEWGSSASEEVVGCYFLDWVMAMLAVEVMVVMLVVEGKMVSKIPIALKFSLVYPSGLS